ncbi:MAG: flagellar basal body-associated FliL family protein [Cellulosilyticaceae bacterium]
MDKNFKIFVIIALVVLTMVATTAVFLVLSIKPQSVEEQTTTTSVNKENLEIVHMAEALNANLKLGEDKVPHIVRLVIGVQVDKKHKAYKDFSKNFEGNQTIIRDGIIDIVRSKTYEDMNEEGAKDELAKEIATRINELLDTDIVQNIYFGDYFIQ